MDWICFVIAVLEYDAVTFSVASVYVSVCLCSSALTSESFDI